MSDYKNDIEKYLKNELTTAERHALEKRALYDPFLADALEGAEQVNADTFHTDVDALNKKLTAPKPVWSWPARVAAGAAILVASTFIIWKVFDVTEQQNQLAFEEKKSEVVQPEPTDSTQDTEEAKDETATTLTEERPTAGPSSSEETKPTPTRPRKEEPKPSQPKVSESNPVTAVAATEDAGEEVPSEIKIEKDEEVTPQPKAEKTDAVLSDRSVEVTRSKKMAARDDQKESAAPVSRTEGTSRIATASIPKIIRGRVTSTEDGSGLPGVNVIIKGTTTGTVTDATGNYEIEVSDPSAKPVLVYSFIGLENKEISTGDRAVVDVSLSMDVAQLSEVVVTAFGVSPQNSSVTFTKIPTVDLAHPTTGYRSFKLYLQQNLRYPEEARMNKVEGRVTIEFTVETNGELTDFKILRGIGYGCDEELIRLIKEGPRWIPTNSDGSSIQDKARVRLKFELPK